MGWTDVANPQDHYFHPRTDDPWWNESSFVGWKLPERNMMAMVYHFFRPNLKMGVGGPWVWDDSGADMSVIRHCGYDHYMPLPEGGDMFDVALPNGLTMETIAPQKAIRYRYENPECSFDVTFEASREPYYAKLKKGSEANDTGVAQGIHDLVKPVPEDYSIGHYEQYGYMNGHMTVNGEEIPVVNSVAVLDRSWGRRPLLANMDKVRVGYSSATVDPDHSFHMWTSSDIPGAQDPVEGTTERVTTGYLVRDGVLGEFVDGTRRIVERGEDGRPLREIIDVTDHLGRTMHAEGYTTNMLRWPGVYGDYMFFAGGAFWEIDGIPQVVGEIQEWMNFRTYKRYMATQRTLSSIRV